MIAPNAWIRIKHCQNRPESKTLTSRYRGILVVSAQVSRRGQSETDTQPLVLLAPSESNATENDAMA